MRREDRLRAVGWPNDHWHVACESQAHEHANHCSEDRRAAARHAVDARGKQLDAVAAALFAGDLLRAMQLARVATRELDELAAHDAEAQR